MITMPEVQARFEQLSKEEKIMLVKIDPDTFAPYIAFEDYNFEIMVKN